MISYFYKNIRGKTFEALESYKRGSWVYVEAPAGEEIDQLVEQFQLDEGHVSDALDEDEMPRMEREGEITYIFTRYAYSDNDLTITTAPLLFIIGEDLFITISTRALPRLDRFLNGKVPAVTTQRTKLLLQVMNQVVDQYDMFLNTISRQIKTIRSRLRVEEIRNQDFVTFVQLEDELNEFLSALTPTNAILRRLLLGKHLKLYAEDENLIEDLLLNNEQSIEECRSMLKTIINIREAYSTIMSNNLNQVIRLLTLVTIMIEVPTLISSVFGMNVPLPFDEHPLAFSGILFVLTALVIALLLVFRRKRWL